MVDPITTVGAGLAILGSKDILNKLLGPTADYVGEEARNLVSKCNINLEDVFLRSKEKLGEEMESTGAVNPRILKQLMDEARFCDEKISREYFAGILATSRTKDSGDDSGLQYIATVRDLSSWQLKLHYIFYQSLKRENNFKNLSLNMLNVRRGSSMYFPMQSLVESMGFSEPMEARYILAPTIHGLRRFGLIGEYYRFGEKELIQQDYPEASEDAVILEPTAFGAELLLWAENIKNCTAGSFLHENVILDPPILELPKGVRPRTPVVPHITANPANPGSDTVFQVKRISHRTVPHFSKRRKLNEPDTDVAHLRLECG